MKYPDGREEAQWPDGTKLWTDGKGHGVMTFPSGMREIYTPICKVWASSSVSCGLKELISFVVTETGVPRWNGQDGVRRWPL